MLVRHANDHDIPGIVNLLKLSLGETSSPKTIAYWQWKHIQNPFGVSPVICAEEEGQIIALRTMLQWKCRNSDQILNAFRAVDTAVSPIFQGKGIFSTLTKEMLGQLSKEFRENLFIFNTPNKKSLPGYLKMGWKSYGRLPVVVLPSFFFRHKRTFTDNLNFTDRDSFLSSENKIENVCYQHNQFNAEGKGLFTPKSFEYLKWRYMDCPFLKYWTYVDDNFFLAGYPKKRGKFIELRIVELMNGNMENVAGDTLKSVISSWVRHSKASFLSMSPSNKLNFGLPGLTLKSGPIMTINPMQVKSKILFDSWQYQLGDLELF